jgi:hypothetical protein
MGLGPLTLLPSLLDIFSRFVYQQTAPRGGYSLLICEFERRHRSPGLPLHQVPQQRHRAHKLVRTNQSHATHGLSVQGLLREQ